MASSAPVAAPNLRRLSGEEIGSGHGTEVISCCARRLSPAKLRPFTATTCIHMSLMLKMRDTQKHIALQGLQQLKHMERCSICQECVLRINFKL